MRRVFSYSVLIICFVVLLTPLYIMIIGSFTHLEGFLMQPPSLLLRNPTLQNYDSVLGDRPIGMWAMNTGIIAGVTVSLSLISTIMAGYCFARYPARWVNIIYALFLLAIMVPKQVLIIPLIVELNYLNLSGTRAAAILPAVFFPVGIFIYTNYVRGVPRAFDDCARIDGANEWNIITRVIIPMTRPAIAAVTTFALMGSLRDFLWQYLTLQSKSLQTLSVGLMAAVYARGTMEMELNPIGTKMAVGMILFVPLLLIYSVLHKHFLRGIAGGGLKG